MLKYVGKRILYMIGVFFVVSIILFVLFNNVPGDRALNQVQNLRGKVSDETFQLRYQESKRKIRIRRSDSGPLCKMDGKFIER